MLVVKRMNKDKKRAKFTPKMLNLLYKYISFSLRNLTAALVMLHWWQSFHGVCGALCFFSLFTSPLGSVSNWILVRKHRFCRHLLRRFVYFIFFSLLCIWFVEYYFTPYRFIQTDGNLYCWLFLRFFFRLPCVFNSFKRCKAINNLISIYLEFSWRYFFPLDIHPLHAREKRNKAYSNYVHVKM